MFMISSKCYLSKANLQAVCQTHSQGSGSYDTELSLQIWAERPEPIWCSIYLSIQIKDSDSSLNKTMKCRLPSTDSHEGPLPHIPRQNVF